jgi:hypothetical protein
VNFFINVINDEEDDDEEDYEDVIVVVTVVNLPSPNRTRTAGCLGGNSLDRRS